MLQQLHYDFNAHPPANWQFVFLSRGGAASTVPDKDEAKALGSKLNWTTKKWYVPTGIKLAAFTKWVCGPVLKGLLDGDGFWPAAIYCEACEHYRHTENSVTATTRVTSTEGTAPTLLMAQSQRRSPQTGP